MSKVLTNKLVYLCFLLALFIFSPGEAATLLQVKNNAEIQADISGVETNRLTLVNDRITSIVGGEGALNFRHDETLGDVYIDTNLREEEMVNVYINTEEGFVYKILFRIKAIPSSQIILESLEKDGLEEILNKRAGVATDNNLIQHSLYLIKKMYKEDFHQKKKIKSTLCKKHNYYDLYRDGYLSGSLEGEILFIKPKEGFSDEMISEESFYENGVLSVYIDYPLNPNNIIKIYRVRVRG